jgi:hypothetical protein
VMTREDIFAGLSWLTFIGSLYFLTIGLGG